MSLAVTAASGQLGKLVLEHLLEDGVPARDIVAIARDRNKLSEFAERGVQVREADYAEPAALEAALRGVERLLLISTSGAGAADVRHANAIRAAEAAGAAHILYTSIINADHNVNPLAVEHLKTEKLLAASTIPATILRNAYYYEVYTMRIPGYLATGKVLGATGHGPISGALRDEFAIAAAKVLASNDVEPRILELGGPSYSLEEFAQAVNEVTGSNLIHEDLPQEQLLSALIANGDHPAGAQFVAAADQAITQGQMDTDSNDLERLVGRPLTGLVDAIRILYKS